MKQAGGAQQFVVRAAHVAGVIDLPAVACGAWEEGTPLRTRNNQ